MSESDGEPEFNPVYDRPIWVQVVDVMRGRIERGVYPERTPIPSETALTQEFGIARGTARKVVARLRDEGLIYTVPQMGSFAAPRDPSPDSEKPGE